jgi:hypothetical protein
MEVEIMKSNEMFQLSSGKARQLREQDEWSDIRIVGFHSVDVYSLNRNIHDSKTNIRVIQFWIVNGNHSRHKEWENLIRVIRFLNSVGGFFHCC